MKKYLLLFVIQLNVIVGFSQDIQLETYASGFDSPVNAAHAGDARLFVVERQGLIKIINSNGTVSNTPFLDIVSLVKDNGGEQGLLSVAFHPNYSANGYFFVNYVNNSGDTVISRFTRNTTDAADPNSEFVLLSIAQPFSNHNGGDMHFGPDDGFLYIATGDGGSGGDPQNNAQDLNSLLGKMLRIDVNNTSTNPDLNYSIPSDNPFIDDANAEDEIWSYGLRNPWKFSFDKLNGDMWIADVGQSNKEEINRVLSTSSGGENFGWRCYEGSSTFNTAGCGAAGNFTFPVAEYSYGGSPFKCSVTGGFRYRGNTETTLQGLYFFADYCSNEIGYVEETSENVFQLNFTNAFSGQNFSSFVEDVNGELYIIGLDSGDISKIIDANLSIDEQNINKIIVYPNPATHKVNIQLGSINPNEIRIINLKGKCIKTITEFTDKNVEVSVENYEKGIYLLEMSFSTGQTLVKKLIVE
jgi:hypothetical protein